MERQDSRQATSDYPHPFIHKLKLTRAQRIRGMVLGTILFPIRIFLVALCFLMMWPIARLRSAGLSELERSRPVVVGWRWWLLHPIIRVLGRAAFFFLGFFWVRVKGRRAGRKEAPVLAVAPHSSFLDMLVLTETQLPTVVSRSENLKIPVIGALLEFNQSVMVNRKNPESRKQAVAQIKERLTSNGYWPQMLMFPEGTTTNGTILIKFKPGAFLAGVPVQPVLLHYPNKLDTVRWTHKGTTWVETLWHTCSQLYTNVTVEYLPVYTPSQEEKDDSNLYADNIQKLMAKALGIPATDHVMGRVPTRMLGGLSLPLEPPARETLSLLHKDGLRESEVKVALTQMIDRCQSELGSSAVVDELVPLMGLTDRQTAAKICGLYSEDDKVDLRQLYLSVAAVSSLLDFKSLLHIAFTLYDTEGSGSLTAVDVSNLMGALVGSPQYHTEELYSELSRRGAPTEQDLFRVLTTHPTYQKLISEYLASEGAESTTPSTPLINGKVANNNEGLPSDNRSALLSKTADNSSALPNKKDD
ncbi:lysophospholipid acyltransferase LPCAT4 [Coregonus clupeaformis]|uniref:lysophospholipid acyltransferase LPCAT4 n=1 Tax=Coregonus clupeaformis TaxID=59861 RepID=UPI001BE03D30|nr:lysophospholipid acyltransferase LPCAT4 [Coregonus clupeaformis]